MGGRVVVYRENCDTAKQIHDRINKSYRIRF